MNRIQLIVYKILIKLYTFVSLLFKLPNPVVAKKIILSKGLYKKLDGNVAYGFFEGMKLPYSMSWGAPDQASMLVGLYEKEVLDVISSAPDHCTKLIDLGAADGYYAIGTTFKGKFKEAICYEMSEQRREIIKQNAVLNSVSKKIDIRGQADVDFLDEFQDAELSECFFLIDIEGDEFTLLNKANLIRLSKSNILVEIHDHRTNDGNNKLDALIKDASEIFNVKHIYNGYRNPYEIKILESYPHDDAWLIMSEGRKRNGHWVHLSPK
jgi:predicted RNA methylase|tara:strand:+ start:1497 stop:2297 length:801 start_codon:yes stop_codon:yes gene_type:complete